jgi:hypothetical protein
MKDLLGIGGDLGFFRMWSGTVNIHVIMFPGKDVKTSDCGPYYGALMCSNLSVPFQTLVLTMQRLWKFIQMNIGLLDSVLITVWILFLFAYGLFDNTIGSLDYIVSNGRLICEWWIEDSMEESGHDSLRHWMVWNQGILATIQFRNFCLLICCLKA